MKIASFALATLISFAPAALFAQTAATIQSRKADQQARIAQGVRTGQLTAAETARLEHGQARINREEHQMRASDGGRLTARERRVLTRRQNLQSRRIYRDKHNGRVRG